MKSNPTRTRNPPSPLACRTPGQCLASLECVMRGIADGSVDQDRGRVLIYALQTASSVWRNTIMEERMEELTNRLQRFEVSAPCAAR